MGLSDEQNAMLRLLARGEQGYADIAALMGLSEREVRAKVVGALAQLRAEGQPVPDVPSPLPEDDARGSAAAPPPAPEPPREEPATPSMEPREPAAGASDREASAREPAAARPRAAAPTSAAPARPAPSGGRTITLPTGRAAWLWGGGVAAAIAAIVVVVIVLTSGGGGGESTTATGEAAGGSAGGKAETAAAAAKQPTEAELHAVDGSDASGRAGFGRVKNKLALQIEATGMAPTTKGTDSYTVWLAASPRRMLPLAFPIEVKASGKGANEIATQFAVPIEVLTYLANGTFDQIAITRTVDKRLEAALRVAQKKKQAPAYTGEAVLRGTITGPIVGLALREKEAKEAEGGK